jgi:hypothetical protein
LRGSLTSQLQQRGAMLSGTALTATGCCQSDEPGTEQRPKPLSRGWRPRSTTKGFASAFFSAFFSVLFPSEKDTTSDGERRGENQRILLPLVQPGCRWKQWDDKQFDWVHTRSST